MREIETLSIRDVKHLCHHLGTNPEELRTLCDGISEEPWCHVYRGTSRNKRKLREHVTPFGRFRDISDRLEPLLQRIMLPGSIYSGKKGRGYADNAAQHVGYPVLIKLDIEDFFPSVKSGRIYDLFVYRLNCEPDVARLLTRLTTFDGCLPQGYPTSTILAAIVIEPLAKRLQKLAAKHRAACTVYVDDITISGGEHVAGFVPLIERIIRQSRFRVKLEKTQILHQCQEQVVTGVRVNSQIDVPRAKVGEVRRLLDDLEAMLEAGKPVRKKALGRIRGKIGHVKFLNAGAGRFLERRLCRILRKCSSPDASPARNPK